MKSDFGLVLGILLAALVIYVIVNPGAAKLPMFDPSIKITSPIEGAVITSNEVTIKFEVDNWEIGDGSHLHLRIDDGCGASSLTCINIDQLGTSLDGDQIAHRSRDPITLTSVVNGKHTIKIFLVKSDHKSIGAMDELTITTEGTMITARTRTGGTY